MIVISTTIIYCDRKGVQFFCFFEIYRKKVAWGSGKSLSLDLWLSHL